MDNKYNDIELWKQYYNTGSKTTLNNLFKVTEGVISKNVNKWSGTLSPEAIKLEAYKLAKNAFDTFNPKKGVKLTTHLTNHLQKLSRINYTHQNLARMPENIHMTYSIFHQAREELKDELGYEPSIVELADKLGWSEKKVSEFIKNDRPEYSEGAGEGTGINMFTRDVTDFKTDYFYHDLNPQDRKIFELTTGYNGSPIYDNSKIIKTLGITQNQLSYKKKQLADRYNKVINGKGI